MLMSPIASAMFVFIISSKNRDVVPSSIFTHSTHIYICVVRNISYALIHTLKCSEEARIAQKAYIERLEMLQTSQVVVAKRNINHITSKAINEMPATTTVVVKELNQQLKLRKRNHIPGEKFKKNKHAAGPLA